MQRLHILALAFGPISSIGSLGAATTSWDFDSGFTSLVTSSSQAEWNTDGDFESWATSNVASPTVSAGVLTGISASPAGNLAAVDPFISISPTLALDLTSGDNDVIEFRLKIGDGATVVNSPRIDVFWGTNLTPGFAGARRVQIDATAIPTWTSAGFGNGDEGNFRVYQVDMTGTAGWDGTLTHLRLDPIAGTVAGGQRDKPFEFDYVRIGSTVPEPSSALLGGLAGLFLIRRRRL